MNLQPWSPGMRTLEAIRKIRQDSSQEAPSFGKTACGRQSGSTHPSSQKHISKVKRKSGSKVHKKGHA